MDTFQRNLDTMTQSLSTRQLDFISTQGDAIHQQTLDQMLKMQEIQEKQLDWQVH
jgi:hypothetical protein